MESGAGSSSDAFFCVASKINVSERITSSSALIDFSRPTKSGTIMCGKTTMSRSGSTGEARLSPAVGTALGLAALVMAPFLIAEHLRHDPRDALSRRTANEPGEHRRRCPAYTPRAERETLPGNDCTILGTLGSFQRYRWRRAAS